MPTADDKHESLSNSSSSNHNLFISRGHSSIFTIASSAVATLSHDTTELDSHADTSVAGANFRILYDTGEYATVHSFSSENKPFDKIPIGTAATAWTDRRGQTYILRLNQALLFGDRLDHSLLCPNQLRFFGHKVDDVPVQFDHTSTHSIHLRSELPDDNEVTLPLMIKGVVSYFTSHYPTTNELDTCPHINLTSDVPWDPNSPHFENIEYNLTSRVEAVSVNGDDIWETMSLSDLPDDTAPVPQITETSQDDEYREPDDYDVFEDPNSEQFISRFTQPASLYDEDEFLDRIIEAITRTSGTHWDEQELQFVEPPESPPTNAQVAISALATNDKQLQITPELLARRWGIGKELAAKTLKVTTQRGIRNFSGNLSKRYDTRLPHLQYPIIKGAKFYTDTLLPNVKSLRMNSVAQVWCDGKGYCLFFPMDRKSEAPTTILKVIQHLNGTPEMVISDGAKETAGLGWKKELNSYRIQHHDTEPYSQWQNKAEAEIREVKRMIKHHMYKSRCPKRFWCYCGEWVAAIRRFTAHNLNALGGTNPYEAVHARTADISEYVQFDWYQYVWFIEPAVPGLGPSKRIGRWLGVATDTGSKMVYNVLNSKGNVVRRSSVAPVKPEELLVDDVIAQMKLHDDGIERRFGDEVSTPEFIQNVENIEHFTYDLFDDEDEPMLIPVDPDLAAPEADEHPLPEVFDQYLSANILIERLGDAMRGTVKRRARDAHGLPIGIPNSNPILDSREYEVEYPDGTVDILTANTIAESLYSRVDAEGHEHLLMREIIEHKFNGDLLPRDDMIIQGTDRLRRTTKGCQLLVKWKDGSTNWVPLADMKESYPVETAEYAVANKIASESCFAWWVPHVIKKRDRIIQKVKGRIIKRTHKFGIEVPRNVKHALEIDEITGTTFWQDAINKEMRNVYTAFDIRNFKDIPAFHKQINCHMIFTIKADTLQRKARFVAGGHMTDPPKDSTYSSVVSRDSVRLFFLIAALNGLEVSCCDVQNAYINAPTKEKVWFRAGPELGEHEGKVVVIVRALYGLKSSGARFREHMAGTLRNLGFASTKADPDVWIRKGCKPNGDKIYEYVLCYVDDILYGGLDAKTFMKRLSDTYKLKDGSVKEPDTYLGADISKYSVTHGSTVTECYSMSSDSYIKRALQVVEDELAQVGKSLKRKASTPLASGYRPELDASKLLGPTKASYYMSLMGILRWAIELGRIDIHVEAGLMSRFQAAPREGHLDQVFHIFAYLKNYSHSRLVFDTTEPIFTNLNETDVDWQEFYPGASEPIPPNMPEPRGKAVTMTCFVDADHGGCQLTRRSHTGVVIFVNRAPILWFSKRQATVESSTFGSESVALRQAIDMIEGLRYKLRMMGVPIPAATQIFCDNDAVVKSTTRPESTLKKKHNAINYHRIREAQAAGHVNVSWVESGHNLADVLTKVLTGPKRRELIRRILYT